MPSPFHRSPSNEPDRRIARIEEYLQRHSPFLGVGSAPASVVAFPLPAVTAAAGSGGGGGSDLAGDVNGPPGANLAQGLQGVPVSSATPSNGNALVYVSANGEWEPDAITLAGDVTGPVTATVVGQINGQPVLLIAPGSIPIGYVLTWDGSEWGPGVGPSQGKCLLEGYERADVSAIGGAMPRPNGGTSPLYTPFTGNVIGIAVWAGSSVGATSGDTYTVEVWTQAGATGIKATLTGGGGLGGNPQYSAAGGPVAFNGQLFVQDSSVGTMNAMAAFAAVIVAL